MKNFFAPRSLCAFASLSLLSVCTGEPSAENVSIDMAECGQEGACIMIFGAVGERFEYAVSAVKGEMPESCREGVNAFGTVSALPQGLFFDSESMALAGVPRQAGFHEFVVQLTENGVVNERVILIDIEDRSAQRSQNSYAGLFFGDIR